jgi:hypothetical protein
MVAEGIVGTPRRDVKSAAAHQRFASITYRKKTSESRCSRDGCTRARLPCDIVQYLPGITLRTTSDCLAKREIERNENRYGNSNRLIVSPKISRVIDSKRRVMRSEKKKSRGGRASNITRNLWPPSAHISRLRATPGVWCAAQVERR